jgi:ribosomal protein L11 methyltransferase
VIRLAIRVRREEAELVLAELIALAPAGVEEVELPEGEIEYAVYGAPGELPELPDLRAAAGEALCDISTTEVPDDWSERWRRFHRPVLIEPPAGSGVPALYVRPPWEAPSERPGVGEIAIDPGQAFGTGAHATTRLCLELLLELAALEPERGALLDVGTGSGVLAIAAAHLGFAPVLALDNEAESVEAAAENARVNGVEIEVRRYDLRSQALPWVELPERALNGLAAPEQPTRARVLMANLLRPLLLDLARSLGAGAAPRHLIAGGLLVGEVDEVARAFSERAGLHERERRERGEWAALWLSAR